MPHPCWIQTAHFPANRNDGNESCCHSMSLARLPVEGGRHFDLFASTSVPTYRIDFFGTLTATLQGRLLMPEALPLGTASSGAIALDPNQQTIYAISASGLTVVTLPSVVDQIAPPKSPGVARHSLLSSFAVGGQSRATLTMP